ncbi:SPOR domain-containing protein [Extensimonas sp. H3M7-6]|uniref:SPOR domain-containing protein n=1 Tax=Extensimonas soli TaxID=3031322 RepID=UPI0023DCD277|nr:SPOR domain-containing protein [Extensimonas sp. H3M7-6]MDF1481174.1 SPOR domain-containing protein [Extensimonas sp. H3M7-6]
MMRLFVSLLFLLNLGYFAWSHGALRTLGLAPAETSEPQHQLQQIRPETLQILRTAPASDAAPAFAPSSVSPGTAQTPASSAPPTDATSGAAAPAAASEAASKAATVAAAGTNPATPATASRNAAAPAVCLQAGTFDAHQAETLRKTLARWPQGSWTLDPMPVAGRWMVYLGRFPQADVLDKKKADLRELGIAFDRPGAAWEPGLSLGRYSTEEAAQRALAELRAKGVRTARVVPERPAGTAYVLRLPAVTEALRPQADALRPQLGGRAWRSCEG